MTNIALLVDNPLFAGLTIQEITAVFGNENYYLRRYAKGSYIVHEGDKCDHLGIIVTGLVEVQAEYASGKTITIHRLQPSDTYGEAVIFSTESRFPATLFCPTECQTIVLEKGQLYTMLHTHDKIMENFLGLLSDRLLTINRRIKILSMETLRQRIAAYLLEENKRQHQNTFNLGVNREQMSRLLNVQRPSLSRELGMMKDEGLIDFTKNHFRIIDPIKLAEIVTEAFG
jgi:CRP-like cAMP-binding protein